MVTFFKCALERGAQLGVKVYQMQDCLRKCLAPDSTRSSAKPADLLFPIFPPFACGMIEILVVTHWCNPHSTNPPHPPAHTTHSSNASFIQGQLSSSPRESEEHGAWCGDRPPRWITVLKGERETFSPLAVDVSQILWVNALSRLIDMHSPLTVGRIDSINVHTLFQR